jgi:hypothetical protein
MILMQRFLIEIPHADSKSECLKAIEIFKKTGSHYLVNADWGCPDGVHKAWLIIDAENKEDALAIVPPWYRESSKIITVDKLSINNIDDNLAHHQN